MKTLIGLGAGGAIVTVVRMLPAWIKLPALVGAGLLAASELNTELNQSRFSSQIFAGQGAEGAAKAADPAATQKAIATGQPVTGAAAMLAAQIQGTSADAKQKEVYAQAAGESEAELAAKKANSPKLTTTEQLRLNEVRQQELETAIKRTQAASAAVGLQLLKSVDYAHGQRVSGDEIARRALNDTFRKLGW